MRSRGVNLKNENKRKNACTKNKMTENLFCYQQNRLGLNHLDIIKGSKHKLCPR